MHLVSYIDTQIARVTPLSVARIFGGLLPRLCSFMLMKLFRGIWVPLQIQVWTHFLYQNPVPKSSISSLLLRNKLEMSFFVPEPAGNEQIGVHLTGKWFRNIR